MLCPCNPCIQRKRACVREAVQHLCILAKSLDCQTIVFLIQEKSCLLSVFDINHISDTIFHNLNFGIKFFTDKAFDSLHAFILTNLCIASFIHATDRNSIF